MTFLLCYFLFFSDTNQTDFRAELFKYKRAQIAIFDADKRLLIGSPTKFTPSKNDVIIAENAIRDRLQSLNTKEPYFVQGKDGHPIIHKKLNRYKRQYVGYVNDKGHRILFINSFWNDKSYSDSWLNRIIQVLDGGSRYWSIEYNLDTDELFNFQVNGIS